MSLIIKKNKIFAFTALFPGVLMADTANQVFTSLEQSWVGMFAMIGEFLWIFAIMPAAVGVYAVSAARKKTVAEAERGMGAQGDQGSTKVGKFFLESKYLAIAILCMYIIYGTFGMVFADAPNFGFTWTALVTSFWSDVFNL